MPSASGYTGLVEECMPFGGVRDQPDGIGRIWVPTTPIHTCWSILPIHAILPMSIGIFGAEYDNIQNNNDQHRPD